MVDISTAMVDISRAMADSSTVRNEHLDVNSSGNSTSKSNVSDEITVTYQGSTKISNGKLLIPLNPSMAKEIPEGHQGSTKIRLEWKLLV
ncbi:hypothetical protein RRG08_049502 [Elysia crispata]|uniref:Uncharacterized protein n=1 Tax=Elysia crispata TaxID=231223 RepID=A0AAE0ZFF6_9GAST|nr:hypothetical protein RRG08_049502 [Elysia crispata]